MRMWHDGLVGDTEKAMPRLAKRTLEQLADALYYQAILANNLANHERARSHPNKGHIAYQDGKARAYEDAARRVLLGELWTGEPLMQQEATRAPKRADRRSRR